MQKTAENKISPLFLENPFKKQLDELSQTHHEVQKETKLDKMFKPKSFEQRWRFCNRVAIIVGYVCNYFSSITALSLLFYLFYLAACPVFGSIFSIGLALIPSIIIVGAIEFVKRHTSDNFLQDVIQFKTFNFGLLLFLGACCTFSIATSFIGAKELPKHFPSSEPLHLNSLYSLDSVLNIESLAHDNEIAIQKLRADTFKMANTNSKGSIRYGAIKPYAALEEELTALKNDKRAALKSLRAQYKVDKLEAITQDKKESETDKEEKAETSIMLGMAAIFSELLFLLCMTGHWWFSWQAQKERYINIDDENTTIVTPNVDDNRNDNRQEEHNQGNQRIGFKQPETDIDDNRNDNRPPHPQLPTCENPNCSKQYLPRHKKQKFCSEDCRKESWQIKKKRKLITKSKL